MNSDPISDFLTRIRNASMVNKPSVSIPHSSFKHELSKLLKTEGYITDVKVNGESSKKELQIDLEKKIGENLYINLMIFFMFCLVWISLLGFGSPLLLLSGILFGKWIGTFISVISISSC